MVCSNQLISARHHGCPARSWMSGNESGHCVVSILCPAALDPNDGIEDHHVMWYAIVVTRYGNHYHAYYKYIWRLFWKNPFLKTRHPYSAPQMIMDTLCLVALCVSLRMPSESSDEVLYCLIISNQELIISDQWTNIDHITLIISCFNYLRDTTWL